MADLDKIKRNVARMARQGAPKEHIDGYIESEGATVDAVKAHRIEQFFDDSEQQQRAADADLRVAKERSEQGPLRTGVRDVLRNISAGTPVGSWLDEANSALEDAKFRVSKGAFGEPYQDRMDYQAAYDRATERDTTQLGRIPGTSIPVTGQGLTMLAGGVASTPLAPMVKPFQGASMLPRVGNSLATGATYGAGYGAGVGQGFEERSTNALMGGGIGAGVGAAAPVVAGGMGYGYNALANRVRPLPAELAGINRRSADLVSEDMLAGGLGDRGSSNYYPRQARRLGPEATFMDMSRNTEQAGMGVAAAGGEGSELVAQTLRSRRALAPDRIRDAVDNALGPAKNVPEFIETSRRVYGARARPLYEQFRSTPVNVTPELASYLGRADAAGAYAAAQRMMAKEGLDPNLATNNGAFVDYVKRAVDDLAGEAVRSNRRNDARILTDIARGIRDETDRILSPNDPTQSIWAQARRVAGEEKGLEEAIDSGRQVFRRGLTPDQLRADMRGNSQLENDGMMMGAREAVRGEMGAAATQFRASPDNAARRLLNSNDAREKLGLVASPWNARNVGRRVDVENKFADTENRVLGNSVTAERQAARERYRGPSDRGDAGNLRGMTVTGAMAEGISRIGNALLRGAIDESRLRTLIDSGRLLSAQGATREQYARGLLAYGQQHAKSTAQSRAIERAAKMIIEGSRTPVIDGATAGK